MTTLCFTGWQQAHDALLDVAPAAATHIDYSAQRDVEGLLRALPAAPDLLVGWSLGAQLAVRAVAAGHVRPKRLVLIAPTFQFLKSPNFAEGMDAQAWEPVLAHYKRDAQDMLRGFNMLVAQGDSNASRVMRALNRNLWQEGTFWLEELARFDGHTMDFNAFPPTTIIHGREDKVAAPAQATAYEKAIPNAQLIWVDNCAHAPHLHDPEFIRKTLAAYV